MKITLKQAPGGEIKREIDFQGAALSDGRSIQGILDENKMFKEDIANLEREVVEKSSIFSKIIPWKWLRDILEITMFLIGILGIIQMALYCFK